MVLHEFSVEMTCGGCSGAVTRILKKQKDNGKVSSFDVKLEEKKVFVDSDLSAEDVETILKKSGKAVAYVGTSK